MKNKKALAILCSSAFILALTLSGCFKNNKSNKESSGGEEPASSESSEATKTWTVTFNSQGGSAVSAQQVKNGEKAKKPTDPTKKDYAFDGWFEEAAAITPFDFNTSITTNWTLYAGWTFNGGGGGSSSSDSQSDSTTTTTSDSQTQDVDFYASIGGTTYELEKQTYELVENQVAEYRADLPGVIAGQSVSILNSEMVPLSDNFGAEPGDNNVTGEVGDFTIHNTAEPAFVLVKTWESGWTNFYISGYQDETPEETYYVSIDGASEIELVKQTYELVENQVAEYRADVGNLLAGQSIEIRDTNHNALSEDFGAEPGDNNVVGTVGSFTIHNDAENAFVIVKTWESGWTNFYVSGYEASTPDGAHGPEGSEPVDWYIVGKGSLFSIDWQITGGVRLYSNPDSETDKGCILSLTIQEGDVFKVTNEVDWYGYDKVDKWDDPANLGKHNFSGVDDGYGGTNIHCDVTGVYDIYVNASGNFWIQAAAELA